MQVFIKKNLNLLLLLFIVIIASFVRFYQLGSAPAGIHADEAAFGYNAYSLLETGKDEYGKAFPIVLKSFGDYKGAIYSYLDVPFIKIFGLNAFAIRFPSALIGVLTVVLIHFFIKRLLRNDKIALLSSFLFAIAPWHVIVSRVTEDVSIGFFFTLLGAYAILRLQGKFKIGWFLTSVVSLLLAILSSPITRIFAVIIPFLLIFFPIEKKKRVLNIVLTLLFLFMGLIYTLKVPIARFNQISIFSSPQTSLIMEEQVREDQFTNTKITRFFHNKVINYGRSMIANFGQYFTVNFLFLDGGYPQRERISSLGLLYLWQLPFLLIGLFYVFKKRDKEYLLLVAWWLVLLIPAAMTYDEIPNVHRSLIVVPSIITIIAIGIYEIFKLFKSKKVFIIILGILTLVGVYEFLYFGHQYLVHQNKHQPWYRGAAFNQLVPELSKYYPNYKKIVITKSVESPYIYILFLGKYSPLKYQKEGSPRDLDNSGFDKYFFVPKDCPLDAGENGKGIPKGTKGYLYINKGSCKTPIFNSRLLKTIYWGDGAPAFKIIEYL
jgi:4-amino-4-deoxy-L-arabinose transferase-like glycosyltransferase